MPYSYDYEEYYEPSAMDEILEEFRQKCTEVFLDDMNSRIGSIVHEKDYYEKESARLQKENMQLEKKYNDAVANLGQVSTVSTFVDLLKTSINSDNKIYTFLELLYEKDFNEEVYDAPLWIGALTQYYSHKDEIIKLFNMLNVKLPKEIENFRLPIDWNEEELDIFFDTVRNHYNCNGCTYQGNLRFWYPYSMYTVEKQCRGTHYSEIPWQYVLRNPMIKQEKYLSQIGQHAADTYGNWSYFYKIDQYLDLTDDEIKTILSNIDVSKLKLKNTEDLITSFILRHIKCIESKEFLDKLYDSFHDTYAFTYNKRVLDMPYEYVKKWASNPKHDPMSFIQRNKDSFTPEQRKELLAIALEM